MMENLNDLKSGEQSGALIEKWFDSKLDEYDCKNCRSSSYQNGRDCKGESSTCSSSDNVFNNLEYFFGEDQKYEAHPCFAQWLCRFGMSYKNINRNELRDRIINCPSFSHAIDLDWRLEDGNDSDELSNCQQLFRLVLSKRFANLYFSFCYNDLKDKDSFWHCWHCNACKGWRVWHCEKCNQCTYGQTLPCERCGASTDDSSFSDGDTFF